MISTEQIATIVNTIRTRFNPTKIYLFGSYAHGTAGENSDLDILVVKHTVTDKMKELIDIKKELISKDYSTDILLYSEKEYATKLSEGWRLFETIQK
jgi:predicted nucleotidyltransferase